MRWTLKFKIYCLLIIIYIISRFSVREDRAKSLQYYEVTIQQYLPDTFKQFFKVTPETMEHLCQKLSDCPELSERVVPGGRKPIPLQK